MTVALVDADVVVYRAGFSADKTLYSVYTDSESATPDFETTAYADVKKFLADKAPESYSISRSPSQEGIVPAISAAKGVMEKIVSDLNASDIKVFLTGSGNFRRELSTYKKYKGNRDKIRRPLYYEEIRQYLIDHWGAEVVEGQEADDALGIHQDRNTVICSIDKDLRQIPGAHYNWVKDEGTFDTVGHEEAERSFYLQAITGDTGDNIFGCPGIGPVKADKLLGNDPDRYWDNVVAAYRLAFGGKKCPPDMRYTGESLVYPHWETGDPVHKAIEDYAEEVAQLVYIRRKEGELWKRPLRTQ